MFPPSTIAAIVAFVLAVVFVFVAPTIAFAVNGQNIVGTPEAAGAYVGTAVGFLGAIGSVVAAFIGYEWRKRDERELKARTCAILVKTAIRPAIREMHQMFALALKATKNEDREKLVSPDFSMDLKPCDAASADKLIDRWRTLKASLVLAPEAADALAHLGARASYLLLRSNSFWEQVRAGPEDDALKVENFPVVAHCVSMAYDALLELNHQLSLLVMDDDPDPIRSVRYYLNDVTHDYIPA